MSCCIAGGLQRQTGGVCCVATGHDYLPNQVLKYSRDSNKAVLVLEGGLASGGLLVGIGAPRLSILIGRRQIASCIHRL